VLVAVLLPRLAHRGMFLDGITYASIARNLAHGRGRFWEPFYTATIYPRFHEHPPLGFWLESLFFRALGDHWWVERLYCATTALLTALLIAGIWRAVYQDQPSATTGPRAAARDFDWLPVLLWMSVPIVSWTIVGNLLEATVSVFVTAAVASLVVPGPVGPTPETPGEQVRPGPCSADPQRRRAVSAAPSIVAGAVSGLCVVAAAFSKGPVGLFPLAAPFALCVLRERRHALRWWILGQWATVGACAVVMLLAPASREGLGVYGNQQVLATLLGRRGTSGSSMTTLVTLLQGVCLPMMLVIGIFRLAAGRSSVADVRERRIAAAFLLLGLIGTLPIMISPRQAGHYISPATPFYALGVAALGLTSTREFLRRLAGVCTRTTLRIAAVAVLALAVAATRVPALERDSAWLADLDRLEAVAPRSATVAICGDVNSNWLLHAWMQRRFEISLDAGAPASRDWFLTTKAGDRQCAAPPCAPVSDSGGSLVLLRCR
jgi:4-amino-4-deoxy-L-arabinose transferase-like glycosyltransferase